MRTFNKLVRDKILQINRDKGIDYTATVLNYEEYRVELNKKLKEEADEYLADNSIEELADLQEVIYAILDERKISREDFEKIRLEKVERRGAFKDRIFLKTLDID